MIKEDFKPQAYGMSKAINPIKKVKPAGSITSIGVGTYHGALGNNREGVNKAARKGQATGKNFLLTHAAANLAKKRFEEIDLLLSLGFGQDKSSESELLDEVLNYITEDATLFGRLTEILLEKKNLTLKSFSNLEEKAEKAGISIDILIEVYQRGYESRYPYTLTQEQRAFNRINSFISGRNTEDQDLLDEMKECPSDRLVGTDSARLNYVSDTPGQSKELKIIRNLIKGKKK